MASKNDDSATIRCLCYCNSNINYSVTLVSTNTLEYSINPKRIYEFV